MLTDPKVIILPDSISIYQLWGKLPTRSLSINSGANSQLVHPACLHSRIYVTEATNVSWGRGLVTYLYNPYDARTPNSDVTTDAMIRTQPYTCNEGRRSAKSQKPRRYTIFFISNIKICCVQYFVVVQVCLLMIFCYVSINVCVIFPAFSGAIFQDGGDRVFGRKHREVSRVGLRPTPEAFRLRAAYGCREILKKNDVHM